MRTTSVTDSQPGTVGTIQGITDFCSNGYHSVNLSYSDAANAAPFDIWEKQVPGMQFQPMTDQGGTFLFASQSITDQAIIGTK